MKLLCAFVFACLGSAFGQLDCQPKSFKATTFDTVRFVPTYSRHDIVNSFTLYENAVDNSTQLYDFTTGTVYNQEQNQACYKFQNNAAQLNQDSAAVQSVRQVFTFTDEQGVVRSGYEVTNGPLVIRAVLTAQCDTSFISFVLNDQVQVANFFTNHEDLTDDDVQKVKTARDAFVAADCELRTVSG